MQEGFLVNLNGTDIHKSRLLWGPFDFLRDQVADQLGIFERVRPAKACFCGPEPAALIV